MKKSTIIVTAALLLGLGGAGYYFYPEWAPVVEGLLGKKVVEEAKIPGSYIGKPIEPAEWGAPGVLEKELAKEIIKRIPSTKKSSVAKFMTEPENRLLLAQWLLAHREAIAKEANAESEKKAKEAIEKAESDIANLKERIANTEGAPRESAKFHLKNRQADLKELRADAKAPRSMAEALRDEPSMKLSKHITANLDWMEQILYSGEMERPGVAFGILAALLKERPDLATSTMKREIATATAIEWARSGWLFPRAIDRADYFLDNWEAERLNTTFDTIPFWLRRMVCGAKGHDNAGSRESFEWALENVHIPDHQYSGCCWRCGYKRHNYFGESIHGPNYYAPYNGVHGKNRLQMTFDVGGVCGGLSHFGAFAAVANGVPAMTAGEPGHCAYIVNVHGKWQPSYSLSWKRGLHWQVWKGVYKYASLFMATDLWSEEQAKKTRLSNGFMTLGEMYASQKESGKALGCYQTAVDVQPLNFQAWRGYAQLLTEQRAQDENDWRTLHTALCQGLVPVYPEVAAELLIQHIYPGLFKAISDHGQRLTCFAEFWKAVDAMGPDRWDIETLCNKQADALKGKNKDETAAATLELYGEVLRHTSGKPAYAPVTLAWGNSIAKGMTPAQQRQFMAATVRGLEGGSGSMDNGARDNMLGQALSGAEQMRDMATFQAIGKLLSDTYRKPKGSLPKFDPFPGKLVSQGGLIYTSSSAHDEPAAHWGVLEPVGGRFHTANEVNPWVVVQLPRTSLINGVVTISTAGHNVRRLHDMKVQFSESGKDDDWHDAGAFPAPSAKAVNRLDLQESKPRARFIRIMRGGSKDFFHLNAIYVYGEHAA